MLLNDSNNNIAHPWQSRGHWNEMLFQNILSRREQKRKKNYQKTTEGQHVQIWQTEKETEKDGEK